MAKKKKKQRKNNKMPPLWWVDKLIYIVLIGLLVFLLCVFFLFVSLDVEQLYFREPGVIAYERHPSCLWALPTFFLLLTVIIALGSAFRSRRPIFGIPSFLYGPSKYPRIYPIFSKDKQKIPPITKRNMLILRTILVVLILICAFTSLLSLWGHDCLYEDGSISRYNMFHKQTDTNPAGEITHIHFSVMRHKRAYYVAMELTTINDETYYFRSYLFNQTDQSWLIQMLQIKNQYPDSIITYDTKRIDQLIAYKNFNDTETAQLYKLFNLES